MTCGHVTTSHPGALGKERKYSGVVRYSERGNLYLHMEDLQFLLGLADKAYRKIARWANQGKCADEKPAEILNHVLGALNDQSRHRSNSRALKQLHQKCLRSKRKHNKWGPAAPTDENFMARSIHRHIDLAIDQNIQTAKLILITMQLAEPVDFVSDRANDLVRLHPRR